MMVDIHDETSVPCQVRITKAALREMVTNVFDDDGSLGIGTPTEPVSVNPMVDPTTASTDPSSPSWAPRNRAEFGVALGRLLDGVSDEEMPGLYKQVKAALAAIGDTEDAGDMKVQQSATHTRAGDTQVEAAVRKAVRRIISEAMPGRDLGFSGPDTYALSEYDDEPWKVYRVIKGKRKRDPEASFDTKGEADQWAEKLRKQFTADEFVVVDESPDDDESESESEKGEWSVPKGSDGMEFTQIAKEMGMSVMGAQALAARALKRFGHMRQMMFGDLEEEGAEPENAEILILTATRDFMSDMNDDRKSQKIISTLTGNDMKLLLPDSLNAYVEFLASSGELPPADVQLLKDHPGVAETLDGYTDFVRSEMLDDLQAEFADLPNDVDKLTGLDAFREYLSKYVKKSIRDKGGDDMDEGATRNRAPVLRARGRHRGGFSRVIAEAGLGGPARASLRSRDPAEVAHGIVRFLHSLGRNVRATATQLGDMRWAVAVPNAGKDRISRRSRDNESIKDIVGDELTGAGFLDGPPLAVRFISDREICVSFREHVRDPYGTSARIYVWAQPVEDEPAEE